MRGVWEWIVKYGPGIAVVIGALWTAATYIDERSQRAQAERAQTEMQIATAKRESQKPFLEKQLNAYFEAASMASQLATLDLRSKLDDWQKARQRFWELYWGELAVVESTEVASAMVSYRNALLPLMDCVDANKIDDCSGLQKALSTASLALAHEARKSIEEGWGYQLPDVEHLVGQPEK
jgi:hypothetical protein